MSDNLVAYEQAVRAWLAPQLDCEPDDIVSAVWVGLPGLYGCDTGCEFVWPGIDVTLSGGRTSQVRFDDSYLTLPQILRALLGNVEGDFGEDPEDFRLHGQTLLEGGDDDTVGGSA